MLITPQFGNYRSKKFSFLFHHNQENHIGSTFPANQNSSIGVNL
jgi:hypothetical protein